MVETERLFRQDKCALETAISSSFRFHLILNLTDVPDLTGCWLEPWLKVLRIRLISIRSTLLIMLYRLYEEDFIDELHLADDLLSQS